MTEFGLGRSKRDTDMLSWVEVVHQSPMVYNYTIPDGIPTWVKMRATNKGIKLE